jgi:hypothetical protein
MMASLVENYAQKNHRRFFDQPNLHSLNNYTFIVYHFVIEILNFWGM